LVHVTVDDEGPGLTAEDLENVFREFAAMSAKPTADEQSHGLGLSIVKRIVVLHGGNAWAENRKDRQGARFCFTMPVPAESVRKCRILAVDDQALNRQVIKRLLSQAGHEVETRGSGAEAIEAIRQGEFDMVFLDVEMPGISGLEATKRIREAGYGVEQLPIIAAALQLVSGQRHERDGAEARKCRGAGTDGGEVGTAEKLIVRRETGGPRH
jgi:CheY-like chemotaxis protein